MFKRLKKRFLISTLIALFAVIGIIVGAINIFNYRSVIKSSDEILQVITYNQGHFPSKPDSIFPEIDFDFTPETPYEVRYFTVTFVDNEVVATNTKSIAAVNDEAAANMAKNVKKTGAYQGFWLNYRFLVDKNESETLIVFLDCTKSLNTANTFLVLSIIISVFGTLLVFFVLLLASDKILRPIKAGYENQKRFITDAGHDIKTPITIIDADAELLEMEIGENEWLSDIKKQSSRLATLTSDLIYLSRMEEIDYAPHIPFSISDTAEDVISSFAAPARTKRIVFNTKIAKNLSCNGDQEAIRKLFTLLIDNAIKYSPENEKVGITLKRRGLNVEIKISNHAPNLTDEAITHMFDRFYRSDPSRSSAGGFGIGLSVASAIVSAHRGRIYAKKSGEILVIDIII